jgi:hypothetical protein
MVLLALVVFETIGVQERPPPFLIRVLMLLKHCGEIDKGAIGQIWIVDTGRMVVIELDVRTRRGGALAPLKIRPLTFSGLLGVKSRLMMG